MAGGVLRGSDGSRDMKAGLGRSAPPRAAAAHAEGLALHRRGELSAAGASFRQAVKLAPEFVPAWLALADLSRLVGDEAGASEAYMRSIEAATRDPLLIDAAIDLREGRLAAAEKGLRARLREQPTDVAAIRMMAELAIQLGRLADAIVLLRRAVTLAPSFAMARELLARTLQRHGHFAEALSETGILLNGDPANPSLAMLKAALLVRIGDQVGAAELYGDILARRPDQAKGWMSYGHVLKAIGRRDDAVAAYRVAIERQADLGEAWWSLANLKTFRFSDDDLAAMRGALATAPEDDDRLHLQFAIGKALEDAGEDAAAFAAYAEGNRIRRARIAYDADATHARRTALTTLLTPAFLARREGYGCPAADPIFVVGLPRAGSTLVEQILASHSRVEGTSELPDLMAIADRLELAAGGDPAAALAGITLEQSRELGEEYLARARIHRHTDRPFFIDKMPNNWLHVGLVRLILPNARIVDARRHPMGCCWSAFKQHFARGQGFSYDLVELGRYYADYLALMAHVDATAPGAVHRVIYEHMVGDTEGEVRGLLAALNLPFEDGCLAFWRNDRTVRTASSEQVRQPIFTEGLDQWRRFEGALAPLAGALGAALEQWAALPAAGDANNETTQSTGWMSVTP